MEQSLNKNEYILEAATILGRQTDFDEMARIVVQKASILLQADFADVLMINPKTRHTVKTITARSKDAEKAIEQKIKLHVSGWIIKNRSPFFTANIREDERFTKSLFRHADRLTILGAPLWNDDRITGTLIIGRENSNRIQLQDEAQSLERFAAVVAPFLHNSSALRAYFSSPHNKRELLQKYCDFGLIGQSKPFLEMLQAIESASSCDVRVLIEGQSGVGKELVARAIHDFSARRKGPFVAIDCGAIPENLVESELYGHKRGAFTGANMARVGLIENANGGTLFMDEIANLPIAAQAKLLRVLQEKKVRPVGSNSTRPVDVRIISASSQSLKKMVESGLFREDLYYRLHVYPIRAPSLNERSEDIPLLAHHFLNKFAAEQNKHIERFHEEVVEFMKARRWMGNIRELENFVERLIALCPASQNVIDRTTLPPKMLAELKNVMTRHHEENVSLSLRDSVAEFEGKAIRQALQESDWNQARAARRLKISAETLRYKMKNFGIVKM